MSPLWVTSRDRRPLDFNRVSHRLLLITLEPKYI